VTPFPYDDAHAATQFDRERAAIDRIFGLLPEAERVELRAVWEKFEAQQSREARFASIVPLWVGRSQGGAHVC
jgi:putative hydrolase of HD superfamily